MTRVIQAFFQGRSGAKPPRPRVTPLNQSQMQLAGSIARRLPEGLRTTMEAFFRTDFSDVRIHQGPQAQTIGAQAFTMGSGIWFAAGQYEPNTQRGQRLIGHELAHVVQQRSGRVHAPGGSLFTIVNDAALEAEADRLGTQAAASVISPAPAQSKNVGALQLKRLAGAAQSSHCGARSDADRVGRRPQAVIIQPMWNALFGTGTLSNAPDPARAEGRVYRYLEGQTEHARDDQGAHWYKHPNGAWISIRAHDGQPPTHGRGVANHDYIRAFTHRLKNISHLQGGWSRLPIRSAFTSSKTRNFDVAQAYHPQKRTYSQTMETAAEIETTIADLNATRYARHFGGHSRIDYEWCHLASFGHAGDDQEANIVAATRHQNTEQMAIEHALNYFKDKGLSVTVVANLVRGTSHLAESINYKIWWGRFLVYSRTMDGRRATEPTHSEIAQIKTDVRRSIGKAFSRSPLRRYAQGWTLDYLDVF